nr:MAG TPA: Laminaripentaose-producing beta-1,3-guluase (LPHase) [Caudoviricetes sp.]DAO09281.1 MAG TPA: Laminaripentaose-producing beta-1,3-guluase (LPHase) [Caudoviricetes sp.]DAO64204.1 MAG TPA: Laminaripentaose-producing beta-1,3-guluase (LPHase) [Bacteriophage sp.]
MPVQKVMSIYPTLTGRIYFSLQMANFVFS